MNNLSFVKRTFCKELVFYVAPLMVMAFICSCNGGKKAVTATTTKEKVLVSEYSKDWLSFKVFEMPEQSTDLHASNKKKIVSLNIRIVNIMDNVSPLRKRCSNLDDYNTLYEYLLNGCKNEIYLKAKDNGISYPVSFSFENNYNAFPFESINVGYAVTKKKRDYQLIYIDRVFSQDTLSFPLNL